MSRLIEFAEKTGQGEFVARYSTTYAENRAALSFRPRINAPSSMQWRLTNFALLLLGVLVGIGYSTQLRFYGFFGETELSETLTYVLLTFVPLAGVFYIILASNSRLCSAIAKGLSTEETFLTVYESGLFFENESVSIFLPFDSIRGISQFGDGAILQSRSLSFYIPDRGFALPDSKQNFLKLLQTKSVHVQNEYR